MTRRTHWNFALLFATALTLQSCCREGRCDFVAALHLPPTQCQPCARMLPVEAGLRTEGYRIVTIDVSKSPEWAGAPGRGYPRYVYVIERGGRNYYTDNVIAGSCSAGQLRRLCVVPTAATVGAWSRNVVRAAFGCPVLEW